MTDQASDFDAALWLQLSAVVVLVRRGR